MKIRKLFGVYIPQALDRDTLIRVRDRLLYRENYFICRAVANVVCRHYPLDQGEYTPQVKAIRVLLENLGVCLSGTGFRNHNIGDHKAGLRKAYRDAGIPENSWCEDTTRARRIVLLNLLIDKLKD